MERLARLGVQADFAHKQVCQVMHYDRCLRPTLVSAADALF